jgi:hypothetical protein
MPIALVIGYELLTELNLINVTPEQLNDWLMVWQEIIIILPPIIVYMIVSGRPIGCIVSHKKLSLKNVLMITVLLFLFMPTMMLVSNITSFFVDDTVNTAISETLETMNPLTAVLSFALMPAIFEELMFRGVIMSGYKMQNMFKAVFISGLFFGMFHLDLYQLPYTFVGGMVFGIFVFCTNSIYGSMLAHFLLNGVQVVYEILVYHFTDPETLKEITEQTITFEDKKDALVSSCVLVLFTLPIFIILLKKFIRMNKSNILEYRYGISDEHLNIDITGSAEKHKIVDVYFILTIVLYVGYMIISKFIFE